MPLRPPSIRENMIRLKESKDFISFWSKYDDIWIITNGFYMTNVLRNPFSNSSWLLGNSPLKQATQELLFLLFFKPTSIVRRKNPSNLYDITFPARTNLTKIMLDFLDDNSYLGRSNDTLLFVALDSDQAIKNISKSFSNSSTTIPGPIICIKIKIVKKYL